MYYYKHSIIIPKNTIRGRYYQCINNPPRDKKGTTNGLYFVSRLKHNTYYQFHIHLIPGRIQGSLYFWIEYLQNYQKKHFKIQIQNIPNQIVNYHYVGDTHEVHMGILMKDCKRYDSFHFVSLYAQVIPKHQLQDDPIVQEDFLPRLDDLPSLDQDMKDESDTSMQELEIHEVKKRGRKKKNKN